MCIYFINKFGVIYRVKSVNADGKVLLALSNE